MKYLFLIFFSFLRNSSFSQKDKEKILANFDYVKYYQDSTIRSAHKFEFTMEWFTVEFNEAGVPVAMGNYQNEKKVGEWVYSDGSHQLFPKLRANMDPNTIIFDQYDPADKRTESLRPRYEADVLRDKQEFQKKYQHLLNP